MRTIALRFAENFAPECGTIAAHQHVIDTCGCVWYGKLGSSVSSSTSKEILAQEDPAVLLIHSGGTDRWWAHVDTIQKSIPPVDLIPAYYRNQAADFGCWLRVVRFEKAAKDVMSRCIVASSGKLLSQASRHSVSPYFIIDYHAPM